MVSSLAYCSSSNITLYHKIYVKGKRPKFNKLEVEPLVVRARDGDIEARNELLFRFQSIIATLVKVCLDGRPNYFSSFSITFLRLFTNNSLENQAAKLKGLLSSYTAEELFHTGQLAVLLAVKKCRTNLASTIVMCFKDLIQEMIEDGNVYHTYDIPSEDCDPDGGSFTDRLSMDIFLNTLSAEELKIIEYALEHKRSKIPESLKRKVRDYFL